MEEFSILEFLNKWAPLTILIVGGFGFIRFIWKASAWKTVVDFKLEKLDKLYDIIISQSRANTIIKSTSPLTLTDYGKELSEKVNAEKLAERYADNLLTEIQSMNEYQIQEFSFKFAKEDLLEKLAETSLEEFDRIAKVAFSEGMELDQVTRVIGLVLRDHLLEMKKSESRD